MILLLSALFTAELLLLFILSCISIRMLFRILHLFFRSDRVVFSIISLIFFPGTVIHELSHFLMATILLVRVRDIHVFPEWDGSYIKLGRVVYEKKDVFRSILVGIAPIIVGIFILWWMYEINIFAIKNTFFQVILIAFIFILSSSMFSSKQDLVDIVYILPILILCLGLLYIFDIPVARIFSNPEFIAGLRSFMYAINTYLGISIGIHIVLIAVLRSGLYIFRKR